MLDDPVKMRTVKTYIHTMHVTAAESSKSKQTVLFVHGFGGSSATYHSFISELSDKFETYSFDLLGMGCSGKPEIEYIKLSNR